MELMIPPLGCRTRSLVCVAMLLTTGWAARAQSAQSSDNSASSKQPNAPATAAPAALRLCSTVVLIADPATSVATGWLPICSDTGTSPKQLILDDFVSSTTKLPLGTKALFFGPNDTTGKPSYTLAKLAAHETTLVRLEISNLWEAGQYEATLVADGNPIGKITGLKYRLPFSVTLDSPSPDKPEVSFERGNPPAVILKNNDDVTYLVSWSLLLKGKKLTGSVELSPKGTASLDIAAPDSWFPWNTRFKDDDRQGQLSLALTPPGQYDPSHWPRKQIQFLAHLGYPSGLRKDVAIFFMVLVLLSAGAIVSFFGHVALPNRIQRSQLKEQLDALGRRTGSISRLVDSRLRVLIGVERHRLQEVLNSRVAFSPDLTSVFSQVQTGIDSLKLQLSLLERIDAAQKLLTQTAQKEMPPSALQVVREQIWRAADQIDKTEPSTDDINSSTSLVDAAEKRLAELNQLAQDDSTDQDVSRILDVRLQRLQANPAPFVGIDPQILGQAGPALQQMHDILLSAIAPYRQHDSFIACSRLDNFTIRIQLIRDFVEISRTSIPAFQTALLNEIPRFVKYIGNEGWDSVTHAETIIQEMREGVFPSDLLNAPAPMIDCGPDLQFANDRIKFGVNFENPKFDSATARYELEAKWDFGDGLTENGWETSHYFSPKTWRRVGRRRATQTRNSANPTISFEFWSTEQVPQGSKQKGSAVPRTLRIQSESSFWGLGRDRNRVEILRFFLALLPALFGMVAGAKEQLLKTDLMSGVLAVLLLGFGSDTIKNLVSKNSQNG